MVPRVNMANNDRIIVIYASINSARLYLMCLIQSQLQGESYKHFINAIRSPATRKGYEASLRRYLIHLKLKDVDGLLLHISNPRTIESQIIDYIMSLRDNGLSHNTIKFLIVPIFTFYQLNDIILNRKKVARYFGEYKRVVRDQAYSTEQIQTALQNTDHRMRNNSSCQQSEGTNLDRVQDGMPADYRPDKEGIQCYEGCQDRG